MQRYSCFEKQREDEKILITMGFPVIGFGGWELFSFPDLYDVITILLCWLLQ